MGAGARRVGRLLAGLLAATTWATTAGAVPAQAQADPSHYVEGAWAGRWATAYDPGVTGGLDWAAVPDAHGRAVAQGLFAGASLAASGACPAADADTEYYTGTYSVRQGGAVVATGRLIGCTAGRHLVGRYERDGTGGTAGGRFDLQRSTAPGEEHTRWTGLYDGGPGTDEHLWSGVFDGPPRSPPPLTTKDEVAPAPGVSFTFAPLQPVDGEAVTFTAPEGHASYGWDFGDLASATGRVVSHAYRRPGSYTAVLTVPGPGGTAQSASAQVEVAALAISIGFVPEPALDGQPITFTAGGGWQEYLWDFGDGASATGREVTHAYALPGTWTATLTASRPGVADGRLAVQVPVVIPALLPAFEPQYPEAGQPVRFSAGSDLEPYAWDFGDGATATGRFASHAYARPDAYQVTLTAGQGPRRQTGRFAVTVVASSVRGARRCGEAAARASQVAREVRVVALQGAAEVRRRGERAWRTLCRGDVLAAGDELNVDPDARVGLEFGDAARVTVEETSQLRIASFFTEGGIVRTELQLEMGQVAARVLRSQTTRSDFRIRSPSGPGSVRGTRFSVLADALASVWSVQEGVVAVTPRRGRSVTLRAGQEVEVTTARGAGRVTRLGRAGTPRGGVSRAAARRKVMDVVAPGLARCRSEVAGYVMRRTAGGWLVAVRLTGGARGSATWRVAGRRVRAANRLAGRVARRCARR